MDVTEYKRAGFDLSQNISQDKINNAEEVVRRSYIVPLCGTAEIAEPRLLIQTLAFLYLLRQNIFATRSGAKIKTWENSLTVEEWQMVSQLCNTCALLLSDFRESLQSIEGATPRAKVYDVCKIYFRSLYFGV